jgi:hypothetical protein
MQTDLVAPMARERDRSTTPSGHLTVRQLADPAQAWTRPSAKKREPLLTLKEVSEILKVSVKQVRRYITDPDPRKRLRCIDMGRGRPKRVDPPDLEVFIRVYRCP